MVDVCTVMDSFMSGSVYPVVGIAGLLTATIVAVCYMAAQLLQSPRLGTWAKTEALQVVISALFAIIIMQLVQVSCTLDANSLVDLVGGTPHAAPTSLFNSSSIYLEAVANFSHAAFVNARYYMGKINMAESYSIWECPLWCFFSQGGSGTSQMPESGKSYLTAGLMVAFNVALFAHMNALMHIFFLGYIRSGFFLFFLPLALILRSLPYLRQVGSLLISVTFGFFVIYPLILSAFSLSLVPVLPTMPLKSESSLTPDAGAGAWLSGNVEVATITPSDMFTAFGEASSAFFYSIFVLTMAILATAAASAYFARLMGEEIDLSRIMQMV